MKEEIIRHINDPKQLERLYRDDRQTFKRALNTLYAEYKDKPLINFWYERLNFVSRENIATRNDLVFAIIIAFLAGIIAKLPDLLSINDDFYYPRNIGFIVFPALTAYFAWNNKLSVSKIAVIISANILGLLFINFLPDEKNSDTLILSCIHLPLFLWSALGFAFTGEIRNEEEKRLAFLKYNGDLVVITALILIAGGIMSGLTVGLFELIGFHIENFYFENIVVFFLPAVPVVGTYLIRTNPQLVGKVSPVIAKIFSPLVLVMLVIYLIAIMYAKKDPYNDREFLMIFNLLLIGVMAIIFFSFSGTPNTSKSAAEIWILLLLSIVTIIVNGYALSAIVFRISEWGITPNRTAVLGGNILILTNLLLVAAQLFKAVSKKTDASGVGKVIAFYLPVYFIWTVIVTFIFPLVFGFK